MTDHVNWSRWLDREGGRAELPALLKTGIFRFACAIVVFKVSEHGY
jgi:hypothetical protein